MRMRSPGSASSPSSSSSSRSIRAVPVVHRGVAGRRVDDPEDAHTRVQEVADALMELLRLGVVGGREELDRELGHGAEEALVGHPACRGDCLVRYERHVGAGHALGILGQAEDETGVSEDAAAAVLPHLVPEPARDLGDHQPVERTRGAHREQPPGDELVAVLAGLCMPADGFFGGEAVGSGGHGRFRVRHMARVMGGRMGGNAAGAAGWAIGADDDRVGGASPWLDARGGRASQPCGGYRPRNRPTAPSSPTASTPPPNGNAASPGYTTSRRVASTSPHPDRNPREADRVVLPDWRGGLDSPGGGEIDDVVHTRAHLDPPGSEDRPNAACAQAGAVVPVRDEFSQRQE